MIATTGFLVMVGPESAHSKSRFQVKSQNLPATQSLDHNTCSEFISGRTVSGTKVAPADDGQNHDTFHPIVRFDLGVGKTKWKYRDRPQRRSGHLTVKNQTVGEVSIDTSSGVVALDGNAITKINPHIGC